MYAWEEEFTPEVVTSLRPVAVSEPLVVATRVRSSVRSRVNDLCLAELQVWG
jgi:hypothetical protein